MVGVGGGREARGRRENDGTRGDKTNRPGLDQTRDNTVHNMGLNLPTPASGTETTGDAGEKRAENAR